MIKKGLFEKFEKFEKFENEEIYKVTLENDDMKVELLSYGGTIHKLIYKGTDVALGFNTTAEYQKSGTYCGALIGRYSNRLGNAVCLIDGKEYQLNKNDGENHLHGGIKGYKDYNWKIEEISDTDEPFVVFSHLDKDGTENYPGTVKVRVTYTLTKDNALKLDYYATTDKTTVINLTNHAYFNLNGYDAGSITEHELFINADYYTPIDNSLTPTGEIKSVKGTPFDFTTAKKISDGIDADDIDIKYGEGYDHNFIINSADLKKPCAVLTGDKSKIKMSVYTNLPGIQFYAGNALDGSDINKNGEAIQKRFGLCLETQFFPDTPNKQPFFPSCEFTKDDVYDFTTIFKFD